MAGTPLHALVLVICACLTVVALGVLRRRRLRRQLAGLVIGFWVVMQTWYFLPGYYVGHDSWPLHVCDLANVIGPIALLTRARWARAVLVFWGIGLTTQSFITPVLDVGPADPRFWLFWLNHSFVLLMALHEVVNEGYRPTRRDLATVIGVSFVYVVAVFAVNLATGWNYGFVGPARPESPTLVDVLGPWPLRVVWMCLIVAAWFAALGAALARLTGGERGGAMTNDETRMTNQ